MSEMYCPNCGHLVVDYRIDQQSAGAREVVLQWTICLNCRHVGLKRWSFADGIIPSPASASHRRHDEPEPSERPRSPDRERS